MPLRIIEDGERIKLERQAPVVSQVSREKRSATGRVHRGKREKETFVLLGPEGCEWARKIEGGIWECAGRLTKEVYGERVEYISLRLKPGALVCADCDKQPKVKLVEY